LPTRQDGVGNRNKVYSVSVQTLLLPSPSKAKKATRAKTIAVDEQYVFSENIPECFLSDLKILKLY